VPTTPRLAVRDLSRAGRRPPSPAAAARAAAASDPPAGALRATRGRGRGRSSV